MPDLRKKDRQDDPLLLFITDLHFSGLRPTWRVGNYVQDLLDKLADVKKIVHDHKVPRVIIGGDLTHSYTVSLELGDRVWRTIEDWGVPVYVVVGNHDLSGNELKTLDRTWLGHVLRMSKTIHKLDKIYDGRICIHGIHFDDGVEEYLKTNQSLSDSVRHFYRVEELTDVDGNPTGEQDRQEVADELIEVVHAMIVPEGIHPDARQVSIKEVKTMAKLVLSGDYHPGWPAPIERPDLAKFVNPGAMARRSSSESDCMRTPRVVIVRRNLDCEYVDLPSSKSPEDAFDLDGAVSAKKWNKELDKYMGGVSEETPDKIDVRERIEQIAKKQRVKRDIKTRALDEYDKAETVIHG